MRGHSISILCLGILLQQALAITQDQLQLTFDAGLTDRRLDAKDQRTVFDTVITIDGLGRWSDGQIVDLTYVAYERMMAFYARQPGDRPNARPVGANLPGKGAPNAITTIVVGDTAYIASTLKGGSLTNTQNIRQGADAKSRNFPVWGPLDDARKCPDLVRNALALCDRLPQDSTPTGHRNGGSCGEIMAAVSFCTQVGTGAKLAGQRIVTVGAKVVDGRETTGILDPCSEPGGTKRYDGEEGCAMFVGPQGLKMRVIDSGIGRQSTTVATNAIRVRHTNFRAALALKT